MAYCQCRLRKVTILSLWFLCPAIDRLLLDEKTLHGAKRTFCFCFSLDSLQLLVNYQFSIVVWLFHSRQCVPSWLNLSTIKGLSLHRFLEACLRSLVGRTSASWWTEMTCTDWFWEKPWTWDCRGATFIPTSSSSTVNRIRIWKRFWKAQATTPEVPVLSQVMSSCLRTLLNRNYSPKHFLC